MRRDDPPSDLVDGAPLSLEPIELDEVRDGIPPGRVNFARLARVQLRGAIACADPRASEIVGLLRIHWQQREAAQREAAVTAWADSLSPEPRT
jgi:hypothetical protein